MVEDAESRPVKSMGAAVDKTNEDAVLADPPQAEEEPGNPRSLVGDVAGQRNHEACVIIPDKSVFCILQDMRERSGVAAHPTNVLS
jgi:hypothetical protein